MIRKIYALSPQPALARSIDQPDFPETGRSACLINSGSCEPQSASVRKPTFKAFGSIKTRRTIRDPCADLTPAPSRPRANRTSKSHGGVWIPAGRFVVSMVPVPGRHAV
jgi:hypothetical protein